LTLFTTGNTMLVSCASISKDRKCRLRYLRSVTYGTARNIVWHMYKLHHLQCSS